MTLRKLIVLTATALSAGTAAALPPAEKCEAGKLKQAGKYGFCRLKAETKAVKTGDAPDYSKCDAKFGLKWTEIENEGGAMCPTSGDQAALGIFISGHTDDVAMALQQLGTGRLRAADTDRPNYLLRRCRFGHRLRRYRSGRRAAEGFDGELHRQRRRDDLRPPDRPDVGEARRRRLDS